jgi:RES domain
MAEFESWNQYSKFAHYVMRKARHVLDEKNQAFVQTVVETSLKRKSIVKKGALLWRAQIGHDWRVEEIKDEDGNVIDGFEVPEPFRPRRMTPLADRASEGRVNAKGIPCFYFSTDMDTAMTEVRPWIGSHVSVSQFVILRELSVVDCSDVAGQWSFLDFGDEEPTPEKVEESVWGCINEAFSKPVTRTEDVAEYAPTQVLAEVFQRAGFDGIIYGSKLGTGKTVAVFDLEAAELANCHLYEVDAVNIKFSVAANPYYIGKYANRIKPPADAPISSEGDQHKDE